jgi:hypothetical protein
VIPDFLKAVFHFLDVMFRIAACRCGHGFPPNAWRTNVAWYW